MFSSIPPFTFYAVHVSEETEPNFFYCYGLQLQTNFHSSCTSPAV